MVNPFKPKPTPFDPPEERQSIKPPGSSSPPPEVNVMPAIDESTLAGRLAAFGVNPNQPSISMELRNQIVGIYNQQVTPLQQAQKQILEQQVQKQAGTQATQGIAQQAATQAAPLINQVGTNDTLYSPSSTGENIAEIGTGIGSIAAGAGSGAGIGAAVGGPIGAGIGAVIGGITGIATKLSVVNKQDVKTSFADYKASKNNMGKIINRLNQGLISPSQAVVEWNIEEQHFNTAERNLQQKTRANIITRITSNAEDEMVQVEGFRRTIPSLRQMLQIAIATPNPSAPLVNLQDTINENG